MFKKMLFTLLTSLLLFIIMTVNVSANEPSEIVNLSLGKPYTTVRVLDERYPDTDNKELTDGKFGTKFYYDENWNGQYYEDTETGMKYDYWPNYTTVIDLGSLKSVTQVSGNFLSQAVIGAFQPKSIRVFASEDGENWMMLSKLIAINYRPDDGIYSYGWHINGSNGVAFDYTEDENSSVKARYIRFDFEKSTGYQFIDEITVMGYNGVRSDALTLTNTTMLEKGTIRKVDESTGYVQDMVLIYQNPSMEWPKEKFKPYLTYIDESGKSLDTLFDTVLFLAGHSDNTTQHSFATENSMVKFSDWEWYLNRTFIGENSDINNLNEAAKQASIDLGNENYKVNLVVMIPYPSSGATDFGVVDGRALNLSNFDDSVYLVKWYCNKVLEYIENGNYEYIDFKGFYWMNEYQNRPDIIKESNRYVKEIGYKSYWIPYFYTKGYFLHEYLGFDAMTLQPNHFFPEEEGNNLGAGGTKIINTVAQLGAYDNFGVEIEFDGRMIESEIFYNRAIDYLNGAVESGFDGPGYFRNYYEAGGAIPMLAYSKNPYVRRFYDDLYAMMNGTYEKRQYINELNDNLLLNKSYTHNGVNWYAERSTDSENIFLTDGIVEGDFYGDKFFGVKNQDVLVDFDFKDAPVTFKQLQLKAFEDHSAGVYLPKNLKIYYTDSEDSDEWIQIYNGEFSEKHIILNSDTDITAYKLKFEFKIDGTFLFLKEILAYDEGSNASSNGILFPLCNVLSQKKYTTNVTNWYTSFGDAVDTDSTRLTDGKYSETFYSGSYFGANMLSSPVIIDFNLTKNVEISEFKMFFIVDEDAGVYLPDSVKIEGKINDSDNFVTLYDGEITDKEFVLASEQKLNLSDLKITFTPGGNFLFISEIEAYNNLTGSKADIIFSYEDVLIGDITGDGKLNRADLLRLAKFFGGAEVTINEPASDVNNDGKINRADLLRLAKIFGGFYTK